MVDTVKISELASVVSPDGTTIVPCVQGGVTKKQTNNQALSLLTVSNTSTVNLTLSDQQITAAVINGGFIPTTANTSSNYPLTDGVAYTADYTGGSTTFDFSGSFNTRGQTCKIMGGQSPNNWSLVIQAGRALVIGGVLYTNTTITSNQLADELTITCIKSGSYIGYASNSAAFIDAGTTFSNITPSNRLVSSALSAIDTEIGVVLASIFNWQNKTSPGTYNLQNKVGFIANTGAGFVGSLPTTAAVGEVYGICGGTSTARSIVVHDGQTLNYGAQSFANSSGMDVAINLQGANDVIIVVCTQANTKFNVYGSSSAQYIRANYTPSNYTPTGSNVDGHLHGIDNALGSISPSTPFTWITLTGSPGTTTLADNTGYICNTTNQTQFILPATATTDFNSAIQGGTSPGWALSNNLGQNIQAGNKNTGIGANSDIESTDASDSMYIGCDLEDQNFVCRNIQGNLIIYSSLTVSDFAALGLLGYFSAGDLPLSPNDPVSNWTDTSGVGNDLLQASGGAQPLYEYNFGNPCVVFNGSSSNLLCSTIVNTTDKFYAFIVGRLISQPVDCQGIVSAYDSAGSTDWNNAGSVAFSNCSPYVQSVRPFQGYPFAMPTFGNTFVWANAFDGASLMSMFTQAGFHQTAASGNFSQNRLLVGARYDSSSINTFGNIAVNHLVVGNGLLTPFLVKGIYYSLSNIWRVPYAI